MIPFWAQFAKYEYDFYVICGDEYDFIANSNYEHVLVQNKSHEYVFGINQIK